MKEFFEINSNFELEEIVSKNKGVLIVDFTSPTCPPCLMLEPIMEELVEKKLCSVAKVNVLENQDLASSYNVSATPTLIIFKDNKPVKTFLGYQPFEAWEKIVKEI